MMKLFKSLFLAVAILFSMICVHGCAGGLLVGTAVVAGGVGTYVYVKGTYRATLQSPIFDADKVIRDVCKRANLISLKRECNGLRAAYVYEDLNGVKVYIKLKSLNIQTTRIYIRVGTTGDKESSRELLQYIDAETQRRNNI